MPKRPIRISMETASGRVMLRETERKGERGEGVQRKRKGMRVKA